jgi:hypothetical protein
MAQHPSTLSKTAFHMTSADPATTSTGESKQTSDAHS